MFIHKACEVMFMSNTKVETLKAAFNILCVLVILIGILTQIVVNLEVH